MADYSESICGDRYIEGAAIGLAIAEADEWRSPLPGEDREHGSGDEQAGQEACGAAASANTFCYVKAGQRGMGCTVSRRWARVRGGGAIAGSREAGRFG